MIIINYKHIRRSFHNNHYFTNYSKISDDMLGKVLTILLYNDNIINKKSFLTRMNNSNFDRRINTYKSKILNKWYNDVNYLHILCDEVENSCTNFNLSVEDYIKYLNLAYAKNRNYCIDIIAFEVFKPYVTNYEADIEFLKSCNFDIDYLSYDDADSKYPLGLGYCCDDCDGNYNDYKYNTYKFNYMVDIDCVNSLVKNKINDMKTYAPKHMSMFNLNF